jgi:hypothetical protein
MLEETKQGSSQDPKTQLNFWNGGKSERQIIKEAIAKAFKVVSRSEEVEHFSKPGPIDIGEIMRELKLKPTNEPLPTEVIVDIVHAKHMASLPPCAVGIWDDNNGYSHDKPPVLPEMTDSDINKKRKL